MDFTITLKEIVEMEIKIFDFDYPLEVITKDYFEERFIKHFYFNEIGSETVGKFKWYLEDKLNLLLPYYNKLFMSQALEQRIQDNYDVTEKFERDATNNQRSTSNNESRILYSDTPKKRIDINTNDYVSNITKDNNSGTNNVTGDNKEIWVRTMKGNVGVQTDADAIQKYESSIRNIMLELFNQLECLFIQVYN